eukprot:4965717-Alexandrium_andersonii.AAC.1
MCIRDRLSHCCRRFRAPSVNETAYALLLAAKTAKGTFKQANHAIGVVRHITDAPFGSART